MAPCKIGLGIAGNFARHLEQAGEVEDFRHVETASDDAPKGLFPFYLEGADAPLGVDPLSSDTIVLKSGEAVQAEPEVALYCTLTYDNGKVTAVTPTAFAPFNDCSLRKKGAKKISEKKNWGEHSKGIGAKSIPIDRFAPGGIMDGWHISSFLRRDGVLHRYGEDAAMLTYSYFHDQLLTWIADRMNHQEGTGPLEPIPDYLARLGHPEEVIVSIGATRYTPYGETTMLRTGDEMSVVLYDSTLYCPDAIMHLIDDGGTFEAEGVTALVQHAR